MKWLRVIFSLGILLFLIGYLYLVEFRQEKKKVEKEKKEKSLFQVKETEIQEITIQRPNEPSFTVALQNGDWRFTQPRPVDADDAEVQYMASRIARAEISSTLEGKEEKTYGFEQPSLTVRITTKGNQKIEVQFGDKTPVGLSYYVKREKKIFLLPEGFYTDFNKKMEDLREKHLFNFTPDEVKEISVRQASTTFKILKTSENKWTLQTPTPFPANRKKVDAFLRSLEFTQVDKFAEDEAKDFAHYGLHAPMAEISLTVQKKETSSTQKLLLGLEKDKEWFVAREGSKEVGVLSPDRKKEILPDLESLKKKTLLDIDQWDVNRVEIVRGKENILIEKDPNGDWKRKKPSNMDVPFTDMNDLFQSLTEKEVMEMMSSTESLALYGLDKPTIKIGLWDSTGKLLGEILLSAHSNQYFGKERAESVVYKIREDLYKTIESQVSQLTKKAK